MKILHAAAIAFLILAAPAWAQQRSLAELDKALAGKWIATIEGESRTRTFEVSAVAQKADGSVVFLATYAFSDNKDPTLFAIRNPTIHQSSGNLLIVFRTGADSAVAVNTKPDGTLVGTIKYPNGQSKAIRFVKQ